MRSLVLALIAGFLAPVSAQDLTPRVATEAGTVAYVGGKWYDGTGFAPRDTTWAVDGVFAAEAPPDRLGARVVDLGTRYIVPPFGDAHTHQLSDPWSVRIAEQYVREGILYALVLTNPSDTGNAARAQFTSPGTMDVAYAHGGLTATESHPHRVYEGIALEAWTPQEQRERRDEIRASRLEENNAYFFLDSLADLSAKWDAYLATNPDHAKLYVLGVTDPDAKPTDRRGLSAEVFRATVHRATEAGLPTWAHVETGLDAKLAAESGTSGLAHLPGYSFARAPSRYHLSDETVRLMGERRMWVTPTVSITPRYTRDRPARLVLARDHQRRTLRRLHDAGARIVIGTDAWGATSKPEADYMVDARFFSPAEMLDLWAVQTPQAVFPDRAIGHLAPGFEASLLALDCDPTTDWTCTEQIAHVEKQGLRLGGTIEESRLGTEADAIAETVRLWQALDVPTFTAAPTEADDPLRRGLKAYVNADLASAERHMTDALAVAPDSLRPAIHRHLAEVAAARFDWDAALDYRRASGEDTSGRTVEGWARFPAARFRLDAPEATVPFDGLRVPATVNTEAVRAIVDTGAPSTGIPRALAERLGLRVDSTAGGVSVIPSMNLRYNTYAVLIDSVQVGEATFYNVPATVNWTEPDPDAPEVSDEPEEIFLGADVLRRFAAGLRYDYAASTFSILREMPATDEPPTFLIDRSSAPTVRVGVAGRPATAIIDTGNQADVYLATGAFEVPPETFSRTASGTLSNGFEWSYDLYDLPLAIPGHPPLTREAYEGSYIFSADDAVTVILGRTVWNDGALTVDFVNRQVQYEPARLGTEAEETGTDDR
ncbi:MAG: aspartyl protease family protein [Bacteroidota bacterium]